MALFFEGTASRTDPRDKSMQLPRHSKTLLLGGRLWNSLFRYKKYVRLSLFFLGPKWHRRLSLPELPCGSSKRSYIHRRLEVLSRVDGTNMLTPFLIWALHTWQVTCNKVWAWTLSRGLTKETCYHSRNGFLRGCDDDTVYSGACVLACQVHMPREPYSQLWIIPPPQPLMLWH